MGCIYTRGNTLWLKFKGPGGELVQKSTRIRVGKEREARMVLEKIEARIGAGARFGEIPGTPLSVAQFAEHWFKQRKTIGLQNHETEEGRIRKHVLPAIGRLRLDEVRPRHLIDLFRELRAAGNLAPRSIHHVYGDMRVMFRDAVIEEL